MELTKSEMRTAHARVLEELRKENVRIQGQMEGQSRQLETVNRNFQMLFTDERTLRLRFGWLEEAARDVVTACPKHLPGEIEKLADELGIEVTENGDT